MAAVQSISDFGSFENLRRSNEFLLIIFVFDHTTFREDALLEEFKFEASRNQQDKLRYFTIDTANVPEFASQVLFREVTEALIIVFENGREVFRLELRSEEDIRQGIERAMEIAGPSG